jgi:hypothetical protein
MPQDGRIMVRKFKPAKTGHAVDLGPSGAATTLAFVNVNDPKQFKDSLVQRKIRQHVMHTTVQARTKCRPKKGDRGKGQVVNQIPQHLMVAAPNSWIDVKICANFKRLFFAMDNVSEGLLSMTMSEALHRTREKAVLDQVKQQTQSLCHMKQYTESITLVRSSMLTSQSTSRRHAVLGTIICLAYFDMRLLKTDVWTMHMRGLQTLVERWGGVQSLESHPPLRQALFINDVLGSLVGDCQPRFPQLSFSKTPAVCPESENLGPKEILRSTIQCAARLATLLNKLPRGTAQQMGLELLVPVCQITHDLLSLPRYSHGTDTRRPLAAAAELIRLAAIALVSTVITCTSGDYLYYAANRRGPVRDLLIDANEEGWAGIGQLRLWMLVVHTTMETGPTRSQFLEEVVTLMRMMRLRSWQDLSDCLYQVAWFKHTATAEMECLKTDVEAILRRSDYQFS